MLGDQQWYSENLSLDFTEEDAGELISKSQAEDELEELAKVDEPEEPDEAFTDDEPKPDPPPAVVFTSSSETGIYNSSITCKPEDFYVALMADQIHDFMNQNRNELMKPHLPNINTLINIWCNVLGRRFNQVVTGKISTICREGGEGVETPEEAVIKILTKSQKNYQKLAHNILSSVGALSIDELTHSFAPISRTIYQMITSIGSGSTEDTSCRPFEYDSKLLERPLLPEEFECLRYVTHQPHTQVIGLVVDATSQRETTFTNVLIRENPICHADDEECPINRLVVRKVLPNEVDMAGEDALFSFQNGINNTYCYSREHTCEFSLIYQNRAGVTTAPTEVMKWKQLRLPSILRLLFNYKSLELDTIVSSEVLLAKFNQYPKRKTGEQHVMKPVIKQYLIDIVQSASQNTERGADWNNEQAWCIGQGDVDWMEQFTISFPPGDSDIVSSYLDPGLLTSEIIKGINPLLHLTRIRQGLRGLFSKIQDKYLSQCNQRWNPTGGSPSIKTEFQQWFSEKIRTTQFQASSFQTFHTQGQGMIRKFFQEYGVSAQSSRGQTRNLINSCTMSELAGIWFMFISYLQDERELTLEILSSLIPTDAITTEITVNGKTFETEQNYLIPFLLNQPIRGPSVGNIARYIDQLTILNNFIHASESATGLIAEFVTSSSSGKTTNQTKRQIFICRNESILWIHLGHLVNGEHHQTTKIQVKQDEAIDLIWMLFHDGYITDLRVTNEYDNITCLPDSARQQKLAGQRRTHRKQNRTKGIQSQLPHAKPLGKNVVKFDLKRYIFCALMNKTLCDLSIGAWVAGNNNIITSGAGDRIPCYFLTFDGTAAQIITLINGMVPYTFLQKNKTLYYTDATPHESPFHSRNLESPQTDGSDTRVKCKERITLKRRVGEFIEQKLKDTTPSESTGRVTPFTAEDIQSWAESYEADNPYSSIY